MCTSWGCGQVIFCTLSIFWPSKEMLITGRVGVGVCVYWEPNRECSQVTEEHVALASGCMLCMAHCPVFEVWTPQHSC